MAVSEMTPYLLYSALYLLCAILFVSEFVNLSTQKSHNGMKTAFW